MYSPIDLVPLIWFDDENWSRVDRISRSSGENNGWEIGTPCYGNVLGEGDSLANVLYTLIDF